MNEETRKKYQRLNDRLNELNMLNGNIAKLAFYLNENDVDNVDRSILISIPPLSVGGTNSDESIDYPLRPAYN